MKSNQSIPQDFGFVYVLTNPSMPGMVKVGYTMGNPEDRAREISGATGVPRPFIVYGSLKIFGVDSVVYAFEQVVHNELSDYRINNNREFFEIDPTSALDVIARLRDSDDLQCNIRNARLLANRQNAAQRSIDLKFEINNALADTSLHLLEEQQKVIRQEYMIVWRSHEIRLWQRVESLYFPGSQIQFGRNDYNLIKEKYTSLTNKYQTETDELLGYQIGEFKRKIDEEVIAKKVKIVLLMDEYLEIEKNNEIFCRRKEVENDLAEIRSWSFWPRIKCYEIGVMKLFSARHKIKEENMLMYGRSEKWGLEY